MTIKKQPMGPYQTNCYIASVDGKDFIIDPGVDATQWVLDNVSNPVAILNTHGHFDHVWSNAELQEKLGIKLYTPEGDIMLLQGSGWMPDLPPSTPETSPRPQRPTRGPQPEKPSNLLLVRSLASPELPLLHLHHDAR